VTARGPAPVLLLATGDTIAHGASRVASGAELAAGAPGVVAEDVLAEPSWDTSSATVFGLARRARRALLTEGFSGVVITCGTDALEDTAFLVDLLTADATARGGIVLTGAVRDRDHPAPDGPANLAASLVAARAVRGTTVCLDGALHAPRWVRQVDATSPAGFSSAPHPLLGRVLGDRVVRLADGPPRPPRVAGEPESDVALITTYPGMPPALLSTAVDAGARGVVLAGTGAGNVPVELFTTIAELTGWDVPVVVASRAHAPATPLDDLPPGTGLAAKVGAIGARGLAPGKARAALMVALGAGGVPAVREWFARL
jgi:L-asparaginase